MPNALCYQSVGEVVIEIVVPPSIDPSFGTKVRAASKSEVVWCWGRQKVESYVLLLWVLVVALDFAAPSLPIAKVSH